MTNMYFSICGFFCILLLVIVFFSKLRIKSSETRLYGFMLISSFIDVVLVLIEVSFGYMNLETLPISLIKLLNKIDFIHYILWPSLMFLYIFNITYENEKLYKNVKKIILILNIIFTFVEFLLPIDIINETNGAMGVTGIGTNVVYGFATFYFIMIIVILLLNVKKVTITKKYIPFIALFILMVVAMYIRNVSPTLIVLPAIIIYIDLIMYFTIENPDIKMIEQLEAANIVAEKANRAKSDFLSSMSHEIRTPLNAIVGFSECIKNCDSLEEAKENADDVISASNTLLEIVNGILDISKIEAGKLEIINSDYDSRKLFNDVVKLIQARIGDKPIEFRVNIAEDLPPVLYGDHTNVKKIAINLLTNAVKYTDKGFVKFEVSCVKTKDDICRILMSVEDTGRGIKKENIDKLFTKFQRLEEDKNTTIEGTGLGLAITKQLVQMMNGNIVVNSIYGRGSKFIAAIDQRISYKEIDTKKEEFAGNLDLTGKRILVVDDNKLNLKVAKKLLEKYNPIVEFAESGMECLEKVKTGKEYDLILMDDMMPKMRGGETLIRLKRIPGYSIPTIALTANAVNGMKEKYLKDGFSDYLSKPIDKKELYDVLKNNINMVKISQEIKPTSLEQKKLKNESNCISYEDYSDKKVLIVDDNNLNIKVASIVLKPYNLNIESVNSGNDAIKKINDGNKYDLIFMDDMMPELSGVETFHKLEELDNFNIPVIILTANAIEGARENYLKEGLNDYLSKPIDKKEMNRVLTKFLGKNDDIENNIKTESIFGDLPKELFNMEDVKDEKEKNENIEELNFDKKEEKIDFLKQNNIDIYHSLEVLGDINTYNDTLKEFIDNLNDRLENLVKCKVEKNMKEYAIQIHALKSDSKYLGFTKLASLAYKQEIESKNDNSEFIINNYSELTDEITKIVKICNKYLKMT